ncbi:MAG: hypothetical protein ACREFU_07235, partial [Acetobacteraceae bacterium]
PAPVLVAPAAEWDPALTPAMPTEALSVDVPWLLAVPAPPTLAWPPAPLLADAPPAAPPMPPVPLPPLLLLSAKALLRWTPGFMSCTVTGTLAPANAMALTVANNIIRGRLICISSFLSAVDPVDRLCSGFALPAPIEMSDLGMLFPEPEWTRPTLLSLLAAVIARRDLWCIPVLGIVGRELR